MGGEKVRGTGAKRERGGGSNQSVPFFTTSLRLGVMLFLRQTSVWKQEQG